MSGGAVMGSLAASVGEGIVNNMFAKDNAKWSLYHQQQMMREQNAMNNANIANAPQKQVEGLRMAGFNPAMVNSVGTAAAANVSQGNVDMPQTIPFDFDFNGAALLEAQKENLEAQTEKLRAEVPQVAEETQNTIVDTLLKNANKEKVEQEKQNIQNMNERYADQNNMIKPMGQVIADKWQQQPWFDKLLPDTQETIRGIANGDIELSVGGMDALERAIKTQSDLSDADHKVIKNAFDNAVLEGQFSDKAIFDAIKKLPESQQKQIEAQKDKLLAERDKILYKMKELIDAELRGKHLSNEQLDKIVKSFTAGDLDYLKSQGEYGKWFEKYSEEMLMRLLPMISGGTAVGRAQRQPGEPKIQTPKTEHRSKTFYNGGLGDWNQGYGVESMKK